MVPLNDRWAGLLIAWAMMEARGRLSALEALLSIGLTRPMRRETSIGSRRQHRRRVAAPVPPGETRSGSPVRPDA